MGEPRGQPRGQPRGEPRGDAGREKASAGTAGTSGASTCDDPALPSVAAAIATAAAAVAIPGGQQSRDTLRRRREPVSGWGRPTALLAQNLGRAVCAQASASRESCSGHLVPTRRPWSTRRRLVLSWRPSAGQDSGMGGGEGGLRWRSQRPGDGFIGE